MTRLIIALIALGGMAGINLVLFVSAAHQFADAQALYDDARVDRRAAQAQREAADAQRHATEAQRAVVEAIADHTRDWLQAALTANAVTIGKRCPGE
jgi:hypothetical protein